MAVVQHHIATLLVFNQLSPGRAQFGLKGLRAATRPDELAALEPHLAAAEAQARHVGRLNRAWRSARLRPRGRTGVQAIDARVDAAVGSIHKPIERAAQHLPEGHALRALVLELLKDRFPAGAAAITTLPYEDELDEVEDLLEVLSAEAMQPVVQKFGLEIWLEVLRDLLPEYEVAVRADAGHPLTFAEVRAARSELQEAIARVRVVVLGRWPGADEAEVRARLLGPLQVQSDAVAEAMRRQTRAQDVNPETGDLVEGEEEGEAEGGAPV